MQKLIYTASKHTVLGLTKAAAIEFAKSNIRINAVCPGVINTEMTRPSLEQPFFKEIIKSQPMGRVGEAEEVATAVLWELEIGNKQDSNILK